MGAVKNKRAVNVVFCQQFPLTKLAGTASLILRCVRGELALAVKGENRGSPPGETPIAARKSINY